GELVSIPPLDVPPLSLATTVTVAPPLALGAVVYVKVPLLSTAGPLRNSAGLLVVTTKLTVWPDSLGGPAEMLVAQLANVFGPASSSEVTSGPLVKLGGSLTAVTVMVKVCGALVSLPPLAVPPSSLAMTVTWATPLASAAVWNVSVPLASSAGRAANRASLSVVRVNVTVWPAATSSGGPARMLVAQLATDRGPASSRTVWSGPLLKLGGSLTGVTVMTNVCGGLVSLP